MSTEIIKKSLDRIKKSKKEELSTTKLKNIIIKEIDYILDNSSSISINDFNNYLQKTEKIVGFYIDKKVINIKNIDLIYKTLDVYGLDINYKKDINIYFLYNVNSDKDISNKIFKYFIRNGKYDILANISNTEFLLKIDASNISDKELIDFIQYLPPKKITNIINNIFDRYSLNSLLSDNNLILNRIINLNLENLHINKKDLNDILKYKILYSMINNNFTMFNDSLNKIDDKYLQYIVSQNFRYNYIAIKNIDFIKSLFQHFNNRSLVNSDIVYIFFFSIKNHDFQSICKILDYINKVNKKDLINIAKIAKYDIINHKDKLVTNLFTILLPDMFKKSSNIDSYVNYKKAFLNIKNNIYSLPDKEKYILLKTIKNSNIEQFFKKYEEKLPIDLEKKVGEILDFIEIFKDEEIVSKIKDYFENIERSSRSI